VPVAPFSRAIAWYHQQRKRNAEWRSLEGDAPTPRRRWAARSRRPLAGHL